MKPCAHFFSIAICIGFLLGCQTGAGKSSPAVFSESSQESTSALEKVVRSVSGQDVGAEDLRDFVLDVSRNAETQSAVESISNAMTGEGVTIKYCPIDGKRYSSKFTVCPEHGIDLKVLEE